MTCIVGLVDNNTKKVFMGADSAGVSGLGLQVRADQKIFDNNGFLMGFTTSFRMGQLLRYSFKPPKYRETETDLMAYMVKDFIDAVRKCLKDGGFAKKDNEVERGGCFLVAHSGRLFCVEGDYQVGETIDGYDAIGCGREYALGSIYSTTDLNPNQRIEKALKSAAKFSAGVCEPFHIMSI